MNAASLGFGDWVFALVVTFVLSMALTAYHTMPKQPVQERPACSQGVGRA